VRLRAHAASWTSHGRAHWPEQAEAWALSVRAVVERGSYHNHLD
jgi:hypothetical protein